MNAQERSPFLPTNKRSLRKGGFLCFKSSYNGELNTERPPQVRLCTLKVHSFHPMRPFLLFLSFSALLCVWLGRTPDTFFFPLIKNKNIFLLYNVMIVCYHINMMKAISSRTERFGALNGSLPYDTEMVSFRDAFLVLNSPYGRGACGVCSGLILKAIRVISYGMIVQLPDRLEFEAIFL